MVCVQKTRWKRQKAKGVNGYKLWYAGLDSRYSAVSTLVVEVRRCNKGYAS